MSRSPCSGMLTGLCSSEQCLAPQVGPLHLRLLAVSPQFKGFCKLSTYVTIHV